MPTGEARTILTAFKVSQREDDAIRKASKKRKIERSELIRSLVLSGLGIA
jgi:hypothetical protein